MLKQPMDLRRPSRRIPYAVGLAFIVLTLFLFQFRLHPSNPASGRGARNQKWTETSGLLRDIRNTTLGVSSIASLLSAEGDRCANPPRSSKRFSLSACHRGLTVVMAWFYKLP